MYRGQIHSGFTFGTLGRYSRHVPNVTGTKAGYSRRTPDVLGTRGRFSRHALVPVGSEAGISRRDVSQDGTPADISRHFSTLWYRPHLPRVVPLAESGTKTLRAGATFRMH